MGISFSGLLFVVFLALKLSGHIHWSWWWVTAPLWVTGIMVIVFLSFWAVYKAIKEPLK
jgi:hypothetical protein